MCMLGLGECADCANTLNCTTHLEEHIKVVRLDPVRTVPEYAS